MIVVLWRRFAHSGGARPRGARPRPETRFVARPQRQGRQAPRGRHGRVGLGAHTPWLTARAALPVGPLFCIIDGPTRGRPWSGSAVRSELRRLAAQAGVRRRFAPHQLRHAHALELAREGVSLNIILRQLGHATSARPPSTCKESTPRRSSPPSTPDARRYVGQRRAATLSYRIARRERPSTPALPGREQASAPRPPALAHSSKPACEPHRSRLSV
jgi:Phage integrase family